MSYAAINKALESQTLESPVTTMKAIQKPAAASGFELISTAKPVPAKGEVLIKVKLASVCGTDFHITSWDDWSAARIKPPLVYGHEFCGHIEALGEGVENLDNAPDLKPGDYVSAEMHWFCGHCAQCDAGHFHICENGLIYGIDKPGCFAEYVVIPAQQIVKLPDSIPPEYGALLDSLGNGVHAVSKGEVKDKTVLVVGCGPVGLFGIAAAKAMGAQAVYASDVSPFRLDLAKKAGATEVFDAKSTVISEAVKAKTNGHGVDVVLEMSGNAAALNDAFIGLRQAGTMVLMGIPKGRIELDINRDIIFKEARVIGVNGRQVFQTWHQMIDLLQGNKGFTALNLDFLITHKMGLSQFGDAMALVSKGECGKILLDPTK